MNGGRHHRWKRNDFALLHEGVFGLEDGMVSTLGALVGIAIGTHDAGVVVLSGFVLIFVESLSMAAGSFLSSKTEWEAKEEQLAEELKEIESAPEDEKEELRQIYLEKGFTKREVDILVKRITSDKRLWLEEMAHHELRLIPHSGTLPSSQALVMGMAYLVGGVIPIFPYLLLPVQFAIPISIFCTILSLFGVGAAKTKFTGRNWMRSGSEMVMISVAAAIVGYLVAKIFSAAV